MSTNYKDVDNALDDLDVIVMKIMTALDLHRTPLKTSDVIQLWQIAAMIWKEINCGI